MANRHPLRLPRSTPRYKSHTPTCAARTATDRNGATSASGPPAQPAAAATGTPPSPTPRPRPVTSTAAPLSASKNARRADGYAGSIGRYAAPARHTPTIAVTISAPRPGTARPRSPGPHPASASSRASRPARASSSPYDSAPPHTTATASGYAPPAPRSTPAPSASAPAAAVSFHPATTCARSAGSSTGTRYSR